MAMAIGMASFTTSIDFSGTKIRVVISIMEWKEEIPTS